MTEVASRSTEADKTAAIGSAGQGDAAIRSILSSEGETCPEKLWPAVDRLRSQAAWEALASVLEGAAARSPSAELTRSIWLELAQVHFRHLGAVRASERWCDRVLATDPDHAEALRLKADAARASGRMGVALEALERLARTSAPEAQPAVLMERAALCAQRDDSADMALSEYRRALEAGGDAISILVRAAPLMLSTGRFDELKAALDEVAGRHLPGGPGAFDEETADPDTRRIAGFLAERYTELADAASQYAHAHPVAAAAARTARMLGASGAAQILSRIQDVGRSWRTHAQGLAERGESTRDKRAAAVLYLRAAEVLYRYGEASDRPRALVDRCLLLAPGLPAALDCLERAARSDGRLGAAYTEFGQMLRTLTSPLERIELFRRMLRLAPEVGEAPADYLEANGDWVISQPLRLADLQAVETAMESVSDLSRRAEWLGRLADGLTHSPGERTRIRLRLGHLLAEAMGRSEDALAVFRGVLADDHGCYDAWCAQYALARDLADDAAAVDALVALSRYAPDLSSRIELLREAAERAGGLAPEARWSPVQRLFLADPADDQARELLSELARVLGREADLSATLEASVSVVAPPRGAELLYAAAEVQRNDLSQPREAVRLLLEAVRLDPANGAAQDLLKALAEAQEDPQGRLAAYRARLPHVDGPEAFDLRVQMAELLTHELNAREEAISEWEALRRERPTHAGALHALAQLYRSEGRWTELLSVLEALEETAGGDGERRRGLRLQRARILKAQLGQGEEAVRLVRKGIDGPADVGAYEAFLREALDEGIEVRAVAELLSSHFASTDRPAEEFSTLESLSKLGDAEAATEAGTLALHRLEDVAAAARMAALACASDQATPKLVRLLLDIGQRPEGRDQARALLGGLTDHATGRATIVAAGLAPEVGAFLEPATTDLPRAMALYRTALEDAPEDRMVLTALVRTLHALGEGEEAIRLLQARYQDTADQEIGALLVDGLEASGRTGEALDALFRIVEAAPERVDLCRRLVDRCEAAEDGARLLRALSLLEAVAPSEAERQQAQLRSSDALRAAGQEAQAAERLRAAESSGAPLDAVVHRALALIDTAGEHEALPLLLDERVRESEQHWSAWLTAARRSLARMTPSAAEFSALARQAAELSDEREGDDRAALSLWCTLWESASLTADERRHLQRLAAASGAVDVLVEAYRGAVSKHPADAAALHRELAQIFEGLAGNDEAAVAQWQAVLELAPDSEDALSALERLHEQQEDPVALAQVLEVRARTESDPQAATGLVLRAVRLLEDQEEAAEAMRILSEWASHERADPLLVRTLIRVMDQRGVEGVRPHLERLVTLAPNVLREPEYGVRLLNMQLDEEAFETAAASCEAWISAHGAEAELMPICRRLLEEGANWAEVWTWLEPALRTAGAWETLFALTMVVAERAGRGEAAEGYCLSALDIAEGALGAPKEAHAAARMLYILNENSDDALNALIRTATAAKAEQSAVEFLAARAQVHAAQSSGRERSLLVWAQTVERFATSREQKATAWATVLSEFPTSVAALDGLEKQYPSEGDARALARVLESRLSSLSEEEQLPLIRRLARIQGDRLGDLDGAVASLRRVLEVCPDDSEALSDLDATLARSGRHAERAEVLARRVALAEASADRAALLLELGSIQKDEIEDIAAAAGTFAEVLELLACGDALHASAMTELSDLLPSLRIVAPQAAARMARTVAPLWTTVGDWQRTIAARELQSDVEADARARVDALLEVSMVYEERLDQPEMAFLAAARAFRIAPADEALMLELERLAQASGAHEELVDTYAEVVDDIEAPAVRSRVRRRIAHIYDNVLGKPNQALPYYREVLAHEPADSAALSASVRIMAANDDVDGQLGVLRAALSEYAPDDPQRLVLLNMIAELLERRGDDSGALVEVVEEISRLCPEDAAVRERRVAAALEAHRPDLADDAISEIIAHSDGAAERVKAYLRQASLRAERLEDDAGALEAVKAALSCGATPAEVAPMLERMARKKGEVAIDAAHVLVSALASAGDTEAELEALGALSQKLSAGEDRKRVLLRMARIYQEILGKPELAFAYLQRAYREDVLDLEVRAELERVASECDADEELLACYLDILEQTSDLDVELGLRRRTAEICDRTLQDAARAAFEFERVLELEPEDVWARDALLRLYRGLGRYEGAVSLLLARAETAANEDDAFGALWEAAELQEFELGDLQGAAGSLEAAGRLRTGDEKVLRALARVYRELDKGPELADVLRRLTSRDGEPGAPEDAIEFARLRIVSADGFDEGLAVLSKLASDSQQHAAICDCLEAALETQSAHSEGRARRAALAELLIRLSGEAGDWHRAVEVSRGQLATATGEARKALFRSIAQIYREKLSRPELAFLTLVQAQNEFPGDVDVFTEIRAAAGAADMLEDLADALEDCASENDDPELRVTLKRRLAEVSESDLEDEARAGEAWLGVLAERPMDEAALTAMHRHHRRAQRWAALVDVLEKRAELAAPQPVLRYELLVELGALWEQELQEAGEAAKVYLRAIELDAPETKERLEARWGFVRTADEGEDAARMVDALRSILAASPEPDEALRCHRQLARLLPADEATSSWEAVLALRPEDDEAHAALRARYLADGDQTALEERLTTRLALLVSGGQDAEARAVRCELAQLSADRGDWSAARSHWAEALDGDERNDALLAKLAEALRQLDDFDELAQVLRRRLPLQESDSDLRRVRYQLAEVLIGSLDAVRDGVDVARRVLDDSGAELEDLRRVEALFEKANAVSDWAEAIAAQARRADDDEAAVDAWMRYARLQEEMLQDELAAVGAYESVLSIRPTHPEAFDNASRLLKARDQNRRLVELVRARADAEEDLSSKLSLLGEVTRLQDEVLKQPDLAFSTACRVVELSQGAASAVSVAEALAERTDNWEILAEVLSDLLESGTLGTQAEPARLRERLASILSDRVGDLEGAEARLRETLAADATDVAARSLLAQLLESDGRHEEAATHLQSLAKDAISEDEQVACLRRLARMQEGPLEDTEAAVRTWQRLIEYPAASSEALEQLPRLFRTLGRWNELTRILQRRIEEAASVSDRVECRMALAELWANEQRDADRAVDGYQLVLEDAPGHPGAVAALEDLLAESGRWAELADVYRRAQSACPGDASLSARLGALLEEQLSDFEGAEVAYSAALAADPNAPGLQLGLCRVLEKLGRWDAVEALMAQRAAQADSSEVKARLLAERAEILQHRLSRFDDAQDVLTELVSLPGQEVKGWRCLAELHESQADWAAADSAYETLLGLELTRSLQSEVWCARARVAEQMEVDRGEVARCYESALAADGDSLLAVRGLRQVLLDSQGESERTASLYAQEAALVADDSEKAGLLEAAGLSLAEQGATAEAVEHLEAAVSAEPLSLGSLRYLAEHYFCGEQWEAAERVLKLLAEALASDDEASEERSRVYYRLAYVAELYGRPEDALQWYLSSYELDGRYLPTLEGLASALHAVGRLEDAQKVLQAILLHHKSTLTEAEVVDTHCQLAANAWSLQDESRAMQWLERALAIDDKHVRSLTLLVEIRERSEDWEAAYDARERLVVLTPGDQRLRLLKEQAALCRDRLQEPYRAIDALQEAKKLAPEDVKVLEELVTLYTATKQMGRAVDVLEDLASIYSDPELRASALFRLGRARWAAQRDAVVVEADLNAALDLNPSLVEAFQLLEQCLYESRAWKRLEENYHRMIKRIPKENKAARVVLWRSLGELYTRVLKNFEGAKVTYEVIYKLNPEDAGAIMTLADLLSRREASVERALELYHEALPLADDPARPARRLFELYTARGDLDRAFCSLSGLVLMSMASEDEVRAYQLLLRKLPSSGTDVVGEELWRGALFHPNARSELGDILDVVYRGAPQLFAAGQNALSLRKKERVDIRGPDKAARLKFFRTCVAVADLFSTANLECYLRGGNEAPRTYPGHPAALVVGETHPALGTMPTRQQAWLLGRQLCFARSDFAAARALSPEEVAAMAEAAIRIYAPEGSGVDLGVDRGAQDAWGRALRKAMSEPALRALKAPVQKCVEGRTMRVLSRHLEALDHTATRASLMVAPDVSLALEVMDQDDLLVGLSQRSRRRELMLFVLSREFMSLRARLGLAIAR